MANQILYGFHNLKDLANERVTTVGVGVINTAIEQASAEHNRQMAALSGFFTQPTTDFQKQFRSVTAARLQPLDENGRARPIKPSGHYTVAFPINMGGSAWGFDYVTSIKMTVQEVNNAVASMFMADARWMRDHILAALFASATYSFVDPLNGSLTIQPLANGDSQVYQIFTGGDVGATETMQLAQAAAIADATNPFPTIYSRLTAHPENSGDVVAFIPNNLTATTTALANFRPVADPNVQLGANTARLTGTLGAGELPGTLLGYCDKCWIVEWRALPDSYIVATTTDGDRPLAMRQDVEPELQGFKQVATRDDHPFYERQYMRRAGFGAWNRVGALVYRIGNGTYAVPANYTPPIL
jgi:hypothetical protein